MTHRYPSQLSEALMSQSPKVASLVASLTCSVRSTSECFQATSGPAIHSCLPSTKDGEEMAYMTTMNTKG